MAMCQKCRAELPMNALRCPSCGDDFQLTKLPKRKSRSKHDIMLFLAEISLICIGLSWAMMIPVSGLDADWCWVAPILMLQPLSDIHLYIYRPFWPIVTETLFLFGLWCGFRAYHQSRPPREKRIVIAKTVCILALVLAVIGWLILPSISR